MGNDVQCITKVQVDAFAEFPSSLHHITQEVFQFVKDFDGMKFADSSLGIRGQCFSHGERTVATECAEFEDAMCSGNLAEHLEQTSLQMARTHARIGQPQMREPLHLMQQLRFWVDMSSDVFVERIVQFLVAEFFFH